MRRPSRSPVAQHPDAVAASRRLARQLPSRTYLLSDTEPVEPLARLSRASWRSELMRAGAVSIVTGRRWVRYL